MTSYDYVIKNYQKDISISFIKTYKEYKVKIAIVGAGFFGLTLGLILSKRT